MQIGKCIIRGLHHQPGLRGRNGGCEWGEVWGVVCLRIELVLMLLRTGITEYELREKFPDTRLQSTNRDRIDSQTGA